MMTILCLFFSHLAKELLKSFTFGLGTNQQNASAFILDSTAIARRTMAEFLSKCDQDVALKISTYFEGTVLRIVKRDDHGIFIFFEQKSIGEPSDTINPLADD